MTDTNGVQEHFQRKYYRPSDVVKITGLSRGTISAALHSGDLEAYKHGRAWLIPVEAVDEWIRGKGVAVTAGTQAPSQSHSYKTNSKAAAHVGS